MFTALAIFTAQACSSGKGIRVYDNKSSLSRPSESLPISKEMIENEITYELYFTLEKNADCIKIDILSSATVNEFSGKKESLKTFFIAEQIIDVSKFSNEKTKYIYSEMGRNFDQGWERKKDITICTDKNDPISALKSSTPYRLRFSNFQKLRCDFEVNVQADCRVFYHEKIPETNQPGNKP